jgi:hypothetical protein
MYTMILMQDMMRTDITGLMKKIPEEKGFQERGISFFYRTSFLLLPCTFFIEKYFSKK